MGVSDLWYEYKKLIFNTFPDLENIGDWANWKENGTFLSAKLYNSKHIIKS